ncbi:uncharacterized protein LOC143063082 isoform X1 [Mytilus galloprovincialis]|uniref:uncharacterized protein LOC143063082 isoform X1 n=1 Tax=Mytilus galloprovincialis TaxID=29158 RepID=UPI003F7CB9AF
MPIQIPQWTEFLSCQVCFHVFDEGHHRPISLACGHTVCRTCLCNLPQKRCPFDQNTIAKDVSELPVNYALLQLVGASVPETDTLPSEGMSDHVKHYNASKRCIEELALHLKPVSAADQKLNTPCPSSNGSEPNNGILSRPMQRKLVTLVNCQLVEDEGRARAIRAARSLGERTVTELILQHQNPQQLSANLWAAVRARGCQFLGPAMQEEVLKLILLALEDGSALSRKVLVLFVVQRLEKHYPQASKTAIGHVVQLLYRASCFKVSKRDEESSLMQLKEEFRSYEALRREHDSQIVQIAMEAGLRIAPDQWSSLLYGDTSHKSHMQSIIDKLQTPQSFSQSVNELIITLQRTGDPCSLQRLHPHLEFLASVDPNPDAPSPSWENLEAVMKAIKTVVQGLVDFIQSNGSKHLEILTLPNLRYKTSMCRDLVQRGTCPRGGNCTFAHSQDELEKYRARNKRLGKGQFLPTTTSALTPKEKLALESVTKTTAEKLLAAEISKSGNSIDTISTDQQGTITTPSGLPQKLAVTHEPSCLPGAMTNMTISTSQASMVPTPMTPHIQNMSGSMGPHVSSFTQNPSPQNCYPPEYYQSCQNTVPMMSMPRMMSYGPTCYQHQTMPPSYRPPVYGMMPPQQCPYQTGMEYTMATRCPPQQPPPPYPGSCMSYDMCQQAHSNLNPYAEPFMVGPHGPAGQQFCCHSDDHRCLVPPHGQAQMLTDLHQRRTEILTRLNKCSSTTSKKSWSGAETTFAEWGSEKSIGRMTCSSQSIPDAASATKIPSVASRETHSGWDSDYQNWSVGDNTSSPWKKNKDTPVGSSDVVADCPDVWNEKFVLAVNQGNEQDTGSDSTDFMLNWLKDIPDDPMPVEQVPIPMQKISKTQRTVSQSSERKSVYAPSTSYHQEYQKKTDVKGDNNDDEDDIEIDYRRLSIASDGDDIIIPFDSKPIVSKFGPISRVKPKPQKSTDPLQATADEKMMTSVTSSLHSRPQVFPTSRVASRKVNQPISAVLDEDNASACTGYSRIVNYPPNVKSCVKKEIARLEEKALNANTEDEWLACELQAVELQISLTNKSISNLPSEELTGTKHWAKYGYDRPQAGYTEWTDLDKALQAQKIETECLKNRKKQEKEDRLLAQKLVLEELNASGP